MNKIYLLILCLFSSVLLAQNVDRIIEVEADTVIIDEHKGLSTYTGKAVIKQGFLTLGADKIQLFSIDKKANKIIANGTDKNLAYYKQNNPKKSRSIEATALNITYLIDKELMLLRGNVELVQGTNSFNGPMIDYDIANDTIISKKLEHDDDKRVKLKIEL